MLGKALFVTKVKTLVSRETFVEILQKKYFILKLKEATRKKNHVFYNFLFLITQQTFTSAQTLEKGMK